MKIRKHPEYIAMSPAWQKCRDVMSGEDRMKEMGALYIPRLSRMDDGQYDAYVGRSRLYNAFSKTVSGYVGLAMRTPPLITSADVFLDIASNIDRSGAGIEDYIKHIIGEVLTTGRGGTLVEYEEVEEGATLADAAGTRPYWAYYAAEGILDHDYFMGVLQYVFLRERVSHRSAFYKDHKTTERYRTLFVEDGKYQQEVFIKDKDKDDEYIKVGETITPKRHKKPLDTIPFVIHQPDFSPKVNKPVLYDLVNLCVSFFKLKADHMHGLHFCSIPTPWTTGVETGDKDNPPPSSIGPEVWHIENENAKVGMLEFSGAGLGAVTSELAEMKEEMAIMGARLLMSETAEKTATAARIKSTGETADLAAVIGVLNTQLNELLWATAQWADSAANEDDYSITLTKNFLPIEIDAQLLLALMKVQQEGGYDLVVLIENLKRGEIVNPATDTQELIDRINAEKEAALIKEAEAMAKFSAEN